MIRERQALDLLTATGREAADVMNQGVRAALRRHKLAGESVVVLDRETGEIVTLSPDEIPDFPEDDEAGDEAGPR